VNGATPAANVVTVPAGASIAAQWDQGAHPGPNMVYMAKVSSATTPTITGLKWTKISTRNRQFLFGRECRRLVVAPHEWTIQIQDPFDYPRWTVPVARRDHWSPRSEYLSRSSILHRLRTNQRDWWWIGST